MNSITLVYPYYRNPKMLALHVANWNLLSRALRPHVAVVLVDDASPEPAHPIFSRCELNKQMYRVVEDKPWNQHAARNIGAHEAPGDWLFMTDMDVVLPERSLAQLMVRDLDPRRHYTFRRVFADGRPEKIHCNTFLVTREKFWEAGGYDERFCGAYGGDGIFLRALERVAPHGHFSDVSVLAFNDMIQDCSTHDWGRKETEFHREYVRRRDEFRGQPPLTMTCKYDRVF